MELDLQPVLGNDTILLAPLKEEDFDALYQVASDPAIWEQHPDKIRSTREGFTMFFKEAMASGGAFTIIDKTSDEVMGSSRYRLFSNNPAVVEIGWTFLAKKYWGGYYNKQVKKMMVEHAFKYVGSVIFMVDKNNFRSQKAVQKIGGQLVSDPVQQLNITPSSPANLVFIVHKEDWQNSY